jgi:hypothetical protein
MGKPQVSLEDFARGRRIQLNALAESRCIELYRTVKIADVNKLPQVIQDLWEVGQELSSLLRTYKMNSPTILKEV